MHNIRKSTFSLVIFFFCCVCFDSGILPCVQVTTSFYFMVIPLFLCVQSHVSCVLKTYCFPAEHPACTCSILQSGFFITLLLLQCIAVHFVRNKMLYLMSSVLYLNLLPDFSRSKFFVNKGSNQKVFFQLSNFLFGYVCFVFKKLW